jgi:predicted nuclease of predicted toxin-antitoxin system
LRILLDECVDWRLARELPGHEIKTVQRMGWLSAKNGVLLALAAKEFDVFITVDKNLDKNLSYQQNLKDVPLSVIVLRVRANRLPHLMPLVPELRKVLRTPLPTAAVFIGPF